MGREVTSLFVGAYALFLLLALKRLSEGQAAYEAFLEGLSSPLGVLFQIITLLFVLYHTTSWFNLTPKAMPVQRGEEFLPGGVIVGAHYAGWVLLSLVVLFLAGVF
jgi:fumarate reductase subunit C